VGDQSESYDVAIIGLGPVGSVLANILGQYGVKTVALDREKVAYHLPRAVMFDDEIMRIFQTLGLSEKMQEIAEVGGGARFVDAENNTLAHWSRPLVASPNGWHVNYRFHQPDLENVLRDGFRRYAQITEYWGCEVTSLQQDSNSVTVNYRENSTDSDKTLRAAYVVGCDGARSFTRDCINPEIDDLGFHEPWLVIDLLMKNQHEIESRESIHFCEPERSGTFVFLGNKRKRWELRLNADDNPDEICKTEFIWPLLERWITPAEADLERATVYTFHSTITQQWQDGRLFIAGDAAHQTPPFMGQGMCAGIRDAANLGWKLLAVLKQGKPETLLETYQSERKPHVKEYIDLTIQIGQMINRTASAIVAGNVTNPEDGPQTLSQLKPTLGPGLSVGSSNLSGHLFPQPKLRSGNLLDDDIGNGFALITSMSFHAEMTETYREKFQKLGITIVSDETDDLEAWFKAHDVGAVLLRPDRYILSTAETPSDLTKLLAFFENNGGSIANDHTTH
jgi:3-(3-hydroxy-phenyl)propionate hydroxylase